jgi:hypothetical protein
MMGLKAFRFRADVKPLKVKHAISPVTGHTYNQADILLAATIV